MWFDGQAAQFEDTAGLDPSAGWRIAEAILKLSGCTGTDILLDVGAGTGTIGFHFADQRIRYIGLDRSWPMLEVFRRKLLTWPQSMLLAQAEGDLPWPIRDHALAAVFSSRVAHHLRTSHFVDEVFRVCRPGGHLLLGQVVRDSNSLPSRLRHYKRSLLAKYGVGAPPAHQVVQQIAEACLFRGASALPPLTVTQWTRATTAARMLAQWNDKPQLSSRIGGATLNAEQRIAIMQSLTDCVRREFADPDHPHEFTEAYTLQDIRLP